MRRLAAGRRAAGLAARLLIPGLLALGGCEGTPAPAALTPVAMDAIPGWRDDHLARVVAPLQAECARLAALPEETPLGGEGVAALAAGTPARWRSACAAAAAVPAGDEAAARRLFATWFAAYRVTGPAVLGFYYTPEVAGAVARSDAFPVPVLARPADLVVRRGADGAIERGRLQDGRLVPYPSRAEIEAACGGRALVWLRGRSDLVLLQMQGAGRVRLADGRVVLLGFDGQNGREHVPVGRTLVERGALAADAVTLPAVRAWLAAHPGEADAVIARDPNYVFFRVVRAGEGVPGALGVAMTPGRSVAVDRASVPLGVPVWIDAADPLAPGARLRRLTVAQDAGSGIDGAGRVDLFLGAGDAAAREAGTGRVPASLFLLLPRAAAPGV